MKQLISEIRIFNSVEELSEKFSSELVTEVHSKLKTNIALSGGNTPKAVFNYIVSFYKEKLDWRKINLFWGDERCVPPDDPESNYGMTKKHLLDYINMPAENVHRIHGENDPEREAERYEGVLKVNLTRYNNIPGFDIIILGLGEDGHTASIFPDQMNLLITGKYCETAVHPGSKQKRITVTGRIINNSEKIYFLVTGKNKSIAADKIINKKNNYLKFPASHIKPVNGKVIWFLDRKAASGLIR